MGFLCTLGSPERPDKEHLKRLKALVRLTGSPWVSDHLCWGSVDGTYSHDLLPLPYTMAAAKRLVGHTATLLEWDANVPSFEEVHTEALKAEKWLEKARQRAA
jgi:uncharacterized protein (UPF0276 family)